MDKNLQKFPEEEKENEKKKYLSRYWPRIFQTETMITHRFKSKQDKFKRNTKQITLKWLKRERGERILNSKREKMYYSQYRQT